MWGYGEVRLAFSASCHRRRRPRPAYSLQTTSTPAGGRGRGSCERRRGPASGRDRRRERDLPAHAGQDVPTALTERRELVRDIEAAGDRGADGRDLLGEPKEDRAHDAAVRHHELAITPGGVFEGDLLLVRAGRFEATDRREFDADDLEDRDRYHRVIELGAADGDVGRHLALGDGGRPQPGDLALELGDVAG